MRSADYSFKSYLYITDIFKGLMQLIGVLAWEKQIFSPVGEGELFGGFPNLGD
jgi:hypothetical protein